MTRGIWQRASGRRSRLAAAVYLGALALAVHATASAQVAIGEPLLTYDGSLNAGEECTTPYATTGWKPATSGRYPAFLYFIGSSAPADYAKDEAARQIAQAMARQGYAAFLVQYDSTANFTQWDNAWQPLLPYQLGNKASCLFDAGRPRSLLRNLCARADVDCSRGIATWGHSQGAALAVMSASYDRRVSAAWVTGFADYAHYVVTTPLGPFTIHSDERAWLRKRLLPASRMRIVNGIADELSSGSAAEMRESITRLTGRSCAAGINECYTGQNSSGWQLVQHNQVNTTQYPSWNRADHCWFNRLPGGWNLVKDYGNLIPDDCLSLSPSVPGAWLYGSSKFALGPSAQWLAQTAALGPLPTAVVDVDFAYLPVVEAQGPYPWGVIDWGPPGTSNFYVQSGAAQPGVPLTPEDPKHMTIGNNVSTPSTGYFEFDKQDGGALLSYWVYNASASQTTVTTRLDFVDGRPASVDVKTIPANTLFTIAPFAAGVRRVTITSSSGSALKFRNFNVLGP